MKKTTLIASSLMLLAGYAANAQLVTYDWVQASTTLAGFTSSGTLTINTGTDAITGFSFTETGPTSGTVTTTGGLTATVLPGGDAQLAGASFNSALTFVLLFSATPGTGTTSDPTEQTVNDNTTITGQWVSTAVPEPTTVLAGALMLLPLGVGAFRAIRKDRIA